MGGTLFGMADGSGTAERLTTGADADPPSPLATRTATLHHRASSEPVMNGHQPVT